MIDDYLLVVSELTTNAVKAGCTAVSITVEVHRDHLRIAAHDDGPGVPRPGTARRPDDRGGRGLPIVTFFGAPPTPWAGASHPRARHVPTIEAAGDCQSSIPCHVRGG